VDVECVDPPPRNARWSVRISASPRRSFAPSGLRGGLSGRLASRNAIAKHPSYGLQVSSDPKYGRECRSPFCFVMRTRTEPRK